MNFRVVKLILVVAIFLLATGVFAQEHPADSIAGDTVKTTGVIGINKIAAKGWQVSAARIFWSLILLVAGFVVIKYVLKLLESVGERWNRIRLFMKRIVPIIRIGSWTIVLYIIINMTKSQIKNKTIVLIFNNLFLLLKI